LFYAKKTQRFGIWESAGEIVAVVCYEMDIGECFLCAKHGYDFPTRDMLSWAESELAAVINGRHKLQVWLPDQETAKRELLDDLGFQVDYQEPVTIFWYELPFPDHKLPEGFSLISLEEENDFKKINDCLWKGFDHGPDPDDDLDCRMLMQSGPGFRKDLTTVVKAPNGEYACFAGM
jgi:hypothetical protein